MSANIIVFDSGYIADQIKKYYERSLQSLDGALKELEKANAHEGWKCNEHNKINHDINEIERGVERIERGMEDLIAVLWGAQQRYKALETHAEGRINSLSETFKQGYVSGDTSLPVTQVPDRPEARVNFINKELREFIINSAGVIGGAVGAVVGLIGGAFIGLVKDLVEFVSKYIDIKEIIKGVPEKYADTFHKFVEGPGAEYAPLVGPAVGMGTAVVDTAKDIIDYCSNDNYDPQRLLEIASSSTDGMATAIWNTAAAGLAVVNPPAAAVCALMGTLGIDKIFLDTGAGLTKGIEMGSALAKNFTANMLTIVDGEMEGLLPEDFPVDIKGSLDNFGLPLAV